MLEKVSWTSLQASILKLAHNNCKRFSGVERHKEARPLAEEEWLPVRDTKINVDCESIFLEETKLKVTLFHVQKHI